MPTERAAPDGDDADESVGSDGDTRPDGDAGSEPSTVDVESIPTDRPIVMFDGVCNLCSGVVSTLLPLDPDGRLRFASLQSPPGQALLERHGFPTEDFDSFVLVEGDQTYTKSSAAIRIAELLGWPYRAATVGRILPKAIRDRLYDVVANNRYDWFGKKDRCMIPDEDVSDRFLSPQSPTSSQS